MRLLYNILLIVLLGFSPAIAGEVTVDVDRLALLEPAQDDYDSLSSRIAIHFNIPDSLEGKKVIYAELLIPLNFSNIDIVGERILELQAHNITSEWDGNAGWNAPWENAGGDIDTLSFYTYTLKMEGETSVYMDVTHFVKPIIESNTDNFGLMLIPIKHDQNVFHIYRGVYNQIANSARLKIKYR
jgi:hypothetical protein